MNINYLIETTLSDDQLFDSGKSNENAKYFPLNIKKSNFKFSLNLKSKLSKLLKVNPKHISGTTISVDANKEEKEADEYLRKQGLIT